MYNMYIIPRSSRLQVNLRELPSCSPKKRNIMWLFHKLLVSTKTNDSEPAVPRKWLGSADCVQRDR